MHVMLLRFTGEIFSREVNEVLLKLGKMPEKLAKEPPPIAHQAEPAPTVHKASSPPSAASSCISSRLTTVIHVTRYHQININHIIPPLSM